MWGRGRDGISMERLRLAEEGISIGSCLSGPSLLVSPAEAGHSPTNGLRVDFTK